jgi:hypothetical protein
MLGRMLALLVATFSLFSCGTKRAAVSLSPLRGCFERSGYAVRVDPVPPVALRRMPPAEEGVQAIWPLLPSSPAPQVLVLLTRSAADEHRLETAARKDFVLQPIHRRALRGGAYVSWFWTQGTNRTATRILQRCLHELD